MEFEWRGPLMSSGRLKVPRPPPPSSPAVTAIMKANRPRDTGPETRLRHALWMMGERGYRVAPKGIPGRPDITYTRGQTAVFVNGCFWHQHGCDSARSVLPKSNRDYWATKFALNRERDRRKVRDLESAGWHVITVWECEVERDAAAVARKVKTGRTILRHSLGVKSQNTGRPRP
jgi:DNA mismatch endonuclease, patch repair protein